LVPIFSQIGILAIEDNAVCYALANGFKEEDKTYEIDPVED